MPIRIKARSGESSEQLMRRFKKMCEKEGLTKDVKRRMYYEKPSERRQRAMRKSIKRIQQLDMLKSGGAGGGAGRAGGAGGAGGSGPMRNRPTPMRPRPR